MVVAIGMAHKLTTCTFCGVGCGIYLETDGNRVPGAYPSMSHPANEGRICVRGWNVHEVASSPDRLKSPLIKREGKFDEVTWAEAINYLAIRLKTIRQQHGPEALAFFNSPRCSNEESYLLQKLARAVIGTNNVDHGTGVYCNNSINILLDMLAHEGETGVRVSRRGDVAGMKAKGETNPQHLDLVTQLHMPLVRCKIHTQGHDIRHPRGRPVAQDRVSVRKVVKMGVGVDDGGHKICA